MDAVFLKHEWRFHRIKYAEKGFLAAFSNFVINTDFSEDAGTVRSKIGASD